MELAQAVPLSDVLVATYTPTAVPTLLAHWHGRGSPAWLYADYPEMFARRPVERWIGRTLPRLFQRILTYSRASIDELPSVARGRARVVGLGLPSWDHLGPPASDVMRPRTALFLGDARPRKGLADFLEAMALAQQSLPDLRVYVATKDSSEVRSQVPFTRVVRPSPAELVELYRRCGVFVSTSWAEGLGIPPLEAMACGAPVVLTDQRGARDYAVDGQNCLLVPVHCPERVARAVVRVLSDPTLARRLSEGGLGTAEAYRWGPALDRFEAALAESFPGRAGR
jgi:glycosyltransferase involved in cell wall biosynthesis